MHHAWARLFFTTAMSWAPWALATPVILSLRRRHPPVRLTPVRTWAVHVAACLIVCFVYAFWNAFFQWLLNPYLYAPTPFATLLRVKVLNSLLASFILYGTVVIVGQMLESRARLAAQQMETVRLNEQLSREQFNALRRQIEPHFLFNTLNGIAGLIREDRNEDAVSMIAGLSDFLRHLLKDSPQQVPLAEELEFLQKYLAIEKMRLGDRLKLHLDISPDLLPLPVPSFILQPMVENSIKHGISQRAGGGEIRISASRLNGTLNFSVYNDGPSLPAGWERTIAGIGIANVRARLGSLYGSRFSFQLENRAPGGVQVTLSVPVETG
jgi:two-component system LytT family sensor kinase